ncbi:hypothetical protein RJ639_040048 [Escallonia herrerae]|uniref:Senescence domain-containing protein n=1 Tax=Escallonia herrerae TaxID=1293975 RepID=A0AA88WKD6_9ASTE|nr:hypothetical protein RJ639_040048 [Escallonia herrerae]
MGPGTQSEVSPTAIRRMKRVKKLTEMSEKVAIGILSGVVKCLDSSLVQLQTPKLGRSFSAFFRGKLFLPPWMDSVEQVLVLQFGWNLDKVCDAVEVAGKNVMSTTSAVTTGLVSQRYGEQAAQVTHEGFSAAGHANGTAWAVFKIRKALNPKSVIKPTTLVKAAAEANSTKHKKSS